MARSWKYVAAWLGTTITAVTVTWLGVRLGIAPAITAEPPVAIDVDRRYTELRFGLEESVPATTAPRPTASARPSPPTRSPTAASRSRTPAATRPTPTPARASSSPPPTRSPSPTADRRPRYRVPADGGSVIVAYSATRVDVVDADPLPGYVASAARRNDTLVVIRLSAPGHTSVINAYWNGGPAAQVLEDYGP
jgi:hypothetical protein